MATSQGKGYGTQSIEMTSRNTPVGIVGLLTGYMSFHCIDLLEIGSYAKKFHILYVYSFEFLNHKELSR